jgi:hypothetical protein
LSLGGSGASFEGELNGYYGCPLASNHTSMKKIDLKLTLTSWKIVHNLIWIFNVRITHTEKDFFNTIHLILSTMWQNFSYQ